MTSNTIEYHMSFIYDSIDIGLQKKCYNLANIRTFLVVHTCIADHIKDKKEEKSSSIDNDSDNDTDKDKHVNVKNENIYPGWISALVQLIDIGIREGAFDIRRAGQLLVSLEFIKKYLNV